jgi:hypothetical protein
MTHFKPTIDLGKYKKYTFTLKRGDDIKKNIDYKNIPNLPGVYVRYNDDNTIPHYIGKAGMNSNGKITKQGLSGRLTNTRGISKNMLKNGFNIPAGVKLISGNKSVSGNGLYKILMNTNNWESMTWDVYVTHNGSVGDNSVELEATLISDYVNQFGVIPSCNNKQ